jgi:Sugar-tranasporters, 12 TM
VPLPFSLVRIIVLARSDILNSSYSQVYCSRLVVSSCQFSLSISSLRFIYNFFFSFFSYSAGDWLQGPYVYFLYSQYGFDKGDIGRLFIAGFGSSMLFGTIVGSLADKQ